MLTVDHRASPFPLSGQCAGGVRQTGEIAARMIADVVTWAPLPLLYALPFAGLVNLDGGTLSDLILICYMLMWVMQPIGYVVTLLNRANATVAVFSLVGYLFSAAFAECSPANVLSHGKVWTLLSASFDLHGNFSRRMARDLDMATAYRTAPHVDILETKRKAVAMLAGCALEFIENGFE